MGGACEITAIYWNALQFGATGQEGLEWNFGLKPLETA